MNPLHWYSSIFSVSFQGTSVFKPNQHGCFMTISLLIEAVCLKIVWRTENCTSAKNISSAYAKVLLALSLLSALQPQWHQPTPCRLSMRIRFWSDRQHHPCGLFPTAADARKKTGSSCFTKYTKTLTVLYECAKRDGEHFDTFTRRCINAYLKRIAHASKLIPGNYRQTSFLP